MSVLALVNPGGRHKSRKHRSAAQRAATRKLIALNRGRQRNPSKRHHVYVTKSRRRNPARSYMRHVRRHRRRNPIRLSLGMLKPAFSGAVGAIAVDAAMTYLPVPASLSFGRVSYLTRGGLAIGLGLLLKRVIGASMAGHMVNGALVVTLRDAIKDFAGQAGFNLGYASPGYMLPTPASQNLRDADAIGTTSMGSASRLREYLRPATSMAQSEGMAEYLIRR